MVVSEQIFSVGSSVFLSTVTNLKGSSPTAYLRKRGTESPVNGSLYAPTSSKSMFFGVVVEVFSLNFHDGFPSAVQYEFEVKEMSIITELATGAFTRPITTSMKMIAAFILSLWSRLIMIILIFKLNK